MQTVLGRHRAVTPTNILPLVRVVAMNASDLSHEFQRLGPWITQFTLEGQTYGGHYNAFDDIRLTWFFDRFPQVQTVLELGSFEGGHTLRLAAHPTTTHILGLEGRPRNLAKAAFVHRVFQSTKVAFRQVDLEHDELFQLGRFDVILCIGVLYHLRSPWDLLRRLRNVSDRVYIWTHIVEADEATTTAQGYPGQWVREHGWDDPLSGLSPTSFWPTREALGDMLKAQGYSRLEFIEPSRYPPGYPVPERACIDVVATTEDS